MNIYSSGFCVGVWCIGLWLFTKISPVLLEIVPDYNPIHIYRILLIFNILYNLIWIGWFIVVHIINQNNKREEWYYYNFRK